MKDGGLVVIQTPGVSDLFDLSFEALVVSKVRGRGLVVVVEQNGKEPITFCILKAPAIAGIVLATKLIGSCSSNGRSHPMCSVQCQPKEASAKALKKGKFRSSMSMHFSTSPKA